MRKLTFAIGAGVLVLFSLIATVSEAHFQVAWQSDLNRSSSHVKWFYDTYRHLPTGLAQAVEDPKNPKRGASWEWLQYRPVSADSYQLWVTRSDLSSREPKSQPHNIAPTAQDVWCTFDVTGKTLASSRLWYW